MTLTQLQKRLQSLDIEQAAVESVKATKETIVVKNREQLLDGKNRLGVDITPSYFNDPFFKTPEAAKRYSDYKDKITPNSKRKPGTPNLFITGLYVHKPLSVEVRGKNLSYDILSPIGYKIFQKYGNNIVGLGGEKKKEYIRESLRPEFVREVKKQLNSK